MARPFYRPDAPVLLILLSLVTMLALRLSQCGQIGQRFVA